jgi:hypothetical protein
MNFSNSCVTSGSYAFSSQLKGLSATGEFDDVNIKGILRWYGSEAQDPSFQKRTDPQDFFRPGQVFALEITSSFWFFNERNWRSVDVSRLPLEPIPILESQALKEYNEDKKKRRAQILALPLEQMIPHCEEEGDGSGTVSCKTCKTTNGLYREWTWTKEEWVVSHFRTHHWQLYKRLRDESKTASPAKLVATIKSLQRSDKSDVASWILPEDISSDKPVPSDMEVESALGNCSSSSLMGGFSKRGPGLMRRFIVLRAGTESCLCIGIHT